MYHLLLPLLAAAPQALFVPLAPTGAARAVDADGSHLVGISPAHGLTWSIDAGMGAIGDLPGGGTDTRGYGISVDGSFLVGVGSSAASFSEPLRAAAGAAPIGLGVPAVSFGQGFANDVSADGAVVVGRQSGGAFVWTSTAGRVPLPGMDNAYAVSDDGTVVVGFTSSPATLGARWTATTGMTLLDDLPGGATGAAALAVSADGLVAVGFGTTAAGIEPVLWPAGSTVPTALGNLPGGRGEAYGVSADGTRVVGTAAINSFDTRAFIWTSATGTVDLRDHLLALGATGLTGWELTSADGISDDGNAVVGTASGPGGTRPYIAYLDQPSYSAAVPYCGPAVPNSTGFGAVLLSTGSASLAANELTLQALRLPVGSVTLFLVSRSAGLVAGPGGSAGTLCLGGAIGRYAAPGQLQSAGPNGQASLALDLMSIPGPTGPSAATAGETWRFQAWYRDAIPGPTSNFSTAVELLVQ